MGALAVIKGFDVIEDFGVCLGAGGEVAAVNEFQLESAPEAFHGGVVIAVAFATHGGDELRGLERLAELTAGVLHAAIGMEEQACRRLAV